MRRASIPPAHPPRLPFFHRAGLVLLIAAPWAWTALCGSASAQRPVERLADARALLSVDSAETSDLPPDATGERATANQVWLVNTRCANRDSGDPELGLTYWRYEAGQWLASSRQELLAVDDPHLPTVVYAHGNRINAPQSSCDGWQIYRSFARRTPPERPFRFVVWSWPSTQVQGELRDVKEKAARSDCQAYYLAWLVDQLHPDEHVGLIGYSYGARIVSGALHILGGGEVSGRALAERLHPQRRPARAVLLAGAQDDCCLAPGRRHGLALTQVDRMLITYNGSDPVLRWYPLLNGIGSDTEALGYSGAAGLGRWGNEARKVRELNVTGWVGAEHDWTRYMFSPALVAEMQPYALGDDVPAE